MLRSASLLWAVLTVLFASGRAASVGKEQTTTQTLSMPGVTSDHKDAYFCSSFPVEGSEYIVKFQPHAHAQMAHHMLLYGCKEPGLKNEAVWNCGEMQSHDSTEKTAGVCGPNSSPEIVYAWGMDAPDLDLPEGVGFLVGAGSDIQYLVLQVHYKSIPTNPDTSGVTITKTKTKQPRRAGVYLLGTGGQIPKGETVYSEVACDYEQQFPIHPFAYRTHAHSLGKVVSGYRVRDGEWTEIGRKSPQDPQMFYNATTPDMEVKDGDFLAARCTFTGNTAHTVYMGATQKDEMCNFYVMYYVDGDMVVPDSVCFSGGFPSSSWKNMKELHAENVPEEASLVPGSSTPIKNTVEANGPESAYESNMPQNDNELEVDNVINYLQQLRGQDKAGNGPYQDAEEMLNPSYGVPRSYYEQEAEQEYPNPEQVIGSRSMRSGGYRDPYAMLRAMHEYYDDNN